MHYIFILLHFLFFLITFETEKRNLLLLLYWPQYTYSKLIDINSFIHSYVYVKSDSMWRISQDILIPFDFDL